MGNKRAKLLLHSCCAPCSTTSVVRLQEKDYVPLLFWYNPNIEPLDEHEKRFNELKKFADKSETDLLDFSYDYLKENSDWHSFIMGVEGEKEGGERCKKCFEFRLKRAAAEAKELGLEFTTTLTVSPYKDSELINNIGQKLEAEIGTPFLNENFKKNDGYKKSVELSKMFNLYRQKYCGCQYSESTILKQAEE